jgi:hypothetical protein
MILNIFGGIVAAIWLIAIREWPVLVIAIVVVLIMSFIIGLIMIPSALLALPGMAMVKKGTGIIGHFLMFCSMLYTYGFLWLWSMITFWWFTNQFLVDGKGFIPFMIMAYIVATAPIAIMVGRDKDPSTAGAITALSTMIGCMIYMLLLIFGAAIWIANDIFIVIMLFGLFANHVIAVQIVTEMRLQEDQSLYD